MPERRLSDEDYREIFLSEKTAEELGSLYDVNPYHIRVIWSRRSKAVLLATRDLPRRCASGRYERERERQIAKELAT